MVSRFTEVFTEYLYMKHPAYTAGSKQNPFPSRKKTAAVPAPAAVPGVPAAGPVPAAVPVPGVPATLAPTITVSLEIGTR
jgi:hypothetical protein